MQVSDWAIKPPVLDDLIAFMWCKMKICPRNTSLGVMLKLYDSSAVTQSRDKLFACIPETDGSRRVKHRKAEETLRSMYELLQQIPSETSPVFAATNLNNLPVVDLKNIDGATLVHNQEQLKTKVGTLQAQIASIKTLLENTSPAGESSREQNLSCSNNSSTGGTYTRTYGSYAGVAGSRPNRQQSDGDRQTRRYRPSNNSQSQQRQANEGSSLISQAQSQGQFQRRRAAERTITERKTGSSLRAAANTAKSSIFVSRLNPVVSADDMRVSFRA